MKQLLRVQKICDDGTALLSGGYRSGCPGLCGQCAGCGGAKQTVLLRAVNAIGAKPGELVTVSAAPGSVPEAAALWLMPPGLFFAGYLAGTLLWQQGTLTGTAALAAGIAGAVLRNRRMAGKRKTVYTITGYPSQKMLESQIKGDNDLD